MQPSVGAGPPRLAQRLDAHSTVRGIADPEIANGRLEAADHEPVVAAVREVPQHAGRLVLAVQVCAQPQRLCATLLVEQIVDARQKDAR